MNLTTVLVFAGMAMIFVALFLVFASVGGLNKEQTGVNRSLSVLDALTAAPDEMKKELDAPFADRVLFPLLARTQGLGRKLTPADANDRIREKLERAGNPRRLDDRAGDGRQGRRLRRRPGRLAGALAADGALVRRSACCS